jgi:hypothetical protein
MMRCTLPEPTSFKELVHHAQWTDPLQRCDPVGATVRFDDAGRPPSVPKKWRANDGRPARAARYGCFRRPADMWTPTRE